uniref:Uncharacterized protein n=1 Tax=Arundo donax TaxID=35708 RepID=A0A0A8ZDC0_ARUDO
MRKYSITLYVLTIATCIGQREPTASNRLLYSPRENDP